MSEQTDLHRVGEMAKMNRGIMDYNMTGLMNRTRKNYMDAVHDIGLYQQTNQGGKNINIDNESELLNGKFGNTITSDKDKVSKLLMSRPFATTPNLASGSVPEVEHLPANRYGQMTREFKKNMDLAGVSIDRFIPLVPEVKKSIAYHEENINPTTWVRGGMDTRTIIRNSDYLKSCGKR